MHARLHACMHTSSPSLLLEQDAMAATQVDSWLARLQAADAKQTAAVVRLINSALGQVDCLTLCVLYAGPASSVTWASGRIYSISSLLHILIPLLCYLLLQSQYLVGASLTLADIAAWAKLQGTSVDGAHVKVRKRLPHPIQPSFWLFFFSPFYHPILLFSYFYLQTWLERISKQPFAIKAIATLQSIS